VSSGPAHRSLVAALLSSTRSRRQH